MTSVSIKLFNVGINYCDTGLQLCCQ